MPDFPAFLLLTVLFSAQAEAGTNYSRCQPNDFKEISHRLSPEGKLLIPKGDRIIFRESYRSSNDLVTWADNPEGNWTIWALERDDAGRVKWITEQHAHSNGLKLPGEQKLIFGYSETGDCYLKEVDETDASRLFVRTYSKAACDAKYGPAVMNIETGGNCYRYAKIYSGSEPSEQEPTEGWRLAREADATYGAKDYDRALSLYQQALKLEPRRCEAMSRVAFIHFEKGDNGKAREMYRSAEACGAKTEEMMRLREAFRQPAPTLQNLRVH